MKRSYAKLSKEIKSNYTDIQTLNIPDNKLRFIQDASLKYSESLKFDNLKDQGICYSSFVAACKFMIANKDL